MRPFTRVVAAMAAAGALSGCAPDAGEHPLAVEVTFARVEGDPRPWSEAVWLGPVVNSSAHERLPRLAPDGRSLYFHSDRPGGLGGTDIWVSRRAGPGCDWLPPVNIGALNTSAGDGDLAFAPSGRMVFYTSGGRGGFGDTDIFVTHRIGPAHDEVWSEPVNLGPAVNTEAHETSSWYQQTGPGGGVLYFNRNQDIWSVPVTRDGRVAGPAAPVDELNLPGVADGALTVGADGRELIFWSGGAAGLRPGSLGLADLWISTRRSVNEPWSEPRNLGPAVNGPFPDLFPGLSWDGRTLFFSSQRPGGLGRNDLWMSTRGQAGAAGSSCEA